MGNRLQLFKYQDKPVRTVTIDGDPWFVAKDVCEILEIGNSRMALDRIGTSMKGVHSIDTLGGNQQMSVINEAGVYKLAFTSRKEGAEQFTDWVASDVLPSIRRHGAYMTPETIEKVLLNPDMIISLATRLKAEQERNAALTEKIEADRPKVFLANCLEVSKDSILIGDLAKLLCQNGLDIGQNRLFEKLREDGYLMKSGSSYNLPTQRSMDLGLMMIKETTFERPNGLLSIAKTAVVTGKGQRYFVGRYVAETAKQLTI